MRSRPVKRQTDIKLTVILGLALGVAAAIPVVGLLYGSRESEKAATPTVVSAITPVSTPASIAIPTPSIPTAPTLPTSKWEYDAKPDEMTGVISHTAILQSDNTRQVSQLVNRDTHAGLVVTDTREGKIKVGAFVEHGTISCIGGCSILARFDENPPVSYQGDFATGSIGALVLEPNNLFVDEVLKATTLKLELPLIQEGRQVFTFTVVGFPAELRQIILKKRT